MKFIISSQNSLKQFCRISFHYRHTELKCVWMVCEMQFTEFLKTMRPVFKINCVQHNGRTFILLVRNVQMNKIGSGEVVFSNSGCRLWCDCCSRTSLRCSGSSHLPGVLAKSLFHFIFNTSTLFRKHTIDRCRVWHRCVAQVVSCAAKLSGLIC